LSDRTIRLVIVGTSSDGERAFQRTGHAADSLHSKVGKLGKGLKALAIAGAAGFAAIGVGRFIRDSIEGLREHNKVVRQTEAVVKSTGGAAGLSVKQITRLSEALERKTAVDADVIQSGANMLATFTNVKDEAGRGNKIFSQATATVLDMSVALGTDTKGAAIQLGKALNDPIKGVGALSRVGVTFTAQQKAQIKTLVESGNRLGAQKIILAELRKEFGGSAEAAASPIARLVVLFRQLQDIVGGVFLPALNTLAKGLGDKLGPAMRTIGEREGPKAAAVLNRWAKALVAAIPPGEQLADSFAKIRAQAAKTIEAIREGAGAFKAAFGGDGVTSDGFVGAMEKLGVKTRQLVDAFQKARKETGGFKQATAGLHDTVSVAGVVLGFLANNLDKLQRFLPLLIGGFLAYKAAQALSNVASFAHVALLPLQIAGTFSLARANRSLAAANTKAAISQTAQTGAQTAGNVAGNVGVLTQLRMKAATLASAVASKVAAAASKVWAAGQWLLNAALTANPIGLVVVAVAALIGILILAYKRSATFRAIVDGVFKWLRTSVPAALKWIGDKILGWVTSGIALFVRLRTRTVENFTALWARAKAIWSGIGTTIKAAVQSVRDYINVRINAIKALWNAGWGAIKRVASDAWAAIKRGGNTFVTAFGTIFGRIGGAIKGGINAGLNLIRRFLQGVENIASKLSLKIELTDYVPRLRRGGLIPGDRGGPNVDSVPMVGVPGEMVLQRPATNALRGAFGDRFLELLNNAHRWVKGADKGGDSGGVFLRRKAGGLVTAGSAIGRAQAFMRSVDPLPYVWGAVGPNAYDCSGLASEILNRLTGAARHQRRFTTSSIGSGVAGLRPGRGTFTIGTTSGTGHMASNVAGLGAEARGSSSGILVGKAARSVLSFARQFYLPQIGGNFVNTGDGGLWQTIAKKLFDAMTGPFRALFNSLTSHGVMGQLGKAVGGKLIGAGASKLKSMVGFDQGGWLLPGLTLAHNGTGRPERVLGPHEDTRLAEAVAVAVARALEHTSVTLDGQRVGELVVAPHLRAYRQFRTVRPRR
jgi:hypothetical protein